MQWDEHHGWLFMGRNLPALRNLFNNYRLPLYGAASGITPRSGVPNVRATLIPVDPSTSATRLRGAVRSLKLRVECPHEATDS